MQKQTAVKFNQVANGAVLQHTPGPWKFRKAQEHFHVEANAPGFGSAVALVHYVGNCSSGWTSETNARLIAAAPELLNALEFVLPLLNEHGHAAKKVRAAIAKAAA